MLAVGRPMALVAPAPHPPPRQQEGEVRTGKKQHLYQKRNGLLSCPGAASVLSVARGAGAHGVLAVMRGHGGAGKQFHFKHPHSPPPPRVEVF